MICVFVSDFFEDLLEVIGSNKKCIDKTKSFSERTNLNIYPTSLYVELSCIVKIDYKIDYRRKRILNNLLVLYQYIMAR